MDLPSPAHASPAGLDCTEGLQALQAGVPQVQHGLTVSRADAQADFPLIYANAAFERLTGYTLSEVLGRNCRFLQQGGQGAEDQARARETMRSALREGLPATVVLRNFRKSGEPFWNELSLTPVRDAGGVLTHYIGVQQEVTERVRNLAQARSAPAGHARFASGDQAAADQLSTLLAHDLREPLSVMRGFAGLAGTALEQRDHAALRGHLDQILQAGDRMNAMMTAVVGLAQVSLTPVEPRPVDLSRMAHHVIAGLQLRSPARAVAVSIEEGLVASGDPVLLRSLLENLLSNAWKYTGRHAQPRIEFGRARTALCGPPGAAPYFVRDNGVGFDPGRDGRAFGLFRRQHAGAGFPGHGIGLVSARTVVARHAGELWAESQPGQGATFFFTLGAAATQPA